MTEADFWMRTVQYATENPEQRFGQAAFNTLLFCRPDLSEQVRGSNLDPFYVRDLGDKRWFAFLKFVSANWGDEFPDEQPGDIARRYPEAWRNGTA